MIKNLEKALLVKKAKEGHPYKLSIEKILEYLRDYRIYSVIAITYGINENNTLQELSAHTKA